MTGKKNTPQAYLQQPLFMEACSHEAPSPRALVFQVVIKLARTLGSCFCGGSWALSQVTTP